MLEGGADDNRGFHSNLLLYPLFQGYYGDPVQTCKPCKFSTLDIVFTILVPLGVLACVCCVWLLLRQAAKGAEGVQVWHKVKNGLKVLFATGQIIASVHSVIRAVVLPENFDKVIRSMKILNFSFFTVVPIR